MASRQRGMRAIAAVAGAGAAVEGVLVHLGRTYGSTRQERTMSLPGDDIVADPKVVTNHAITIDVLADCVWPWLVQMGWHRGGWYTARWVDRLLFPANWPSANRIIAELQDIHVGSFIPDGAPETETGMNEATRNIAVARLIRRLRVVVPLDTEPRSRTGTITYEIQPGSHQPARRRPRAREHLLPRCPGVGIDR